MKMTRGTNLMQQLWFIIIIISTCFGHLYVHLQEYRLYVTVYGVVAVVLRSRCVVLCTVCKVVYRYPKHVEIFMTINHNCCIKLVTLVIFILILYYCVIFVDVSRTLNHLNNKPVGQLISIHTNSCTFSYNYVSVFYVILKSLKTLQEALQYVSIFYEIIFRDFFIYFLVDVADIKNY